MCWFGFFFFPPRGGFDCKLLPNSEASRNTGQFILKIVKSCGFPDLTYRNEGFVLCM